MRCATFVYGVFVTYFTRLKFNPYHDKLGRFSTTGAASSIQDISHSGEAMVSPNVSEHGMTGTQAARRLRSKEQQRYEKAFAEVDNILGVMSEQIGAVGAWADGGENSTLQTYGKGVSYDMLRVSAAMKGMIAEQKAVVVFKARAGGSARMHSLTVQSSQSVGRLSKGLVEAGIPYHTIIKTEGGYQIKVFDPDIHSKDSVAKAVRVYSNVHSATHSFSVGDGEFSGDPEGSSRAKGIDAYEKTIKPYMDANPEAAGKWSTMLSQYKSRVSKFASLLGGL